MAIVGEFKRGKSTLVNALLGAEVVPSGVLPLTAVPTEIHYGEPATTVTFQNGDTRRIESSQLAEYVTEAANPENLRGVTRVEVARRSPLLAHGVVLVDTPGIGSVHLHNTAAGHAALLDADGAVMVLSADTPLSDQERALVAQLAERRAPTFFVLNKADHLSNAELAEVTAFVGRILVEQFGEEVPIYPVDARSALAVRCSGTDHVGEVGVDFDAFARQFERFVTDDLVGSLAASARGELARLGASLQGALGLEQAARNASAADLDHLVSRFTTEADRQRDGFEDDCTLLDRDVARLTGEVSARLDAFARDSPATYVASLADISSVAPRGDLVMALHAGVRDAVQAGFEVFRREEVGLNAVPYCPDRRLPGDSGIVLRPSAAAGQPLVHQGTPVQELVLGCQVGLKAVPKGPPKKPQVILGFLAIAHPGGNHLGADVPFRSGQPGRRALLRWFNDPPVGADDRRGTKPRRTWKLVDGGAQLGCGQRRS